MNVLLIGDYPPPYGGVAIHVQQLQSFLRSADVEATVLDIGKGGRQAPDVLPVHTGVRLLAQLTRFLARGYVPHLHTSGNNPKAWLLAAGVGTAARLARAGAVITLHSGLLPGYLAESPGRRRFARMALSGYDRVIAVSEEVADALAGSGVPASRIRVYPAFCASQVKPGPAPAAFADARARRGPLLAMAHHPSPVYGRGLMLAALAKLAEKHPRIGLAVFGPGTQSPEFLADAETYGVTGRIEDFGELPHDQALGLIQGCDTFVRPTTADGDSISVREAMALGVPCVASDVCQRPRGVRLFQAGDAAALAARIDEALGAGPPSYAGPDAGPVLLGIYRRLSMGRRSYAEPAAAGPWRG